MALRWERSPGVVVRRYYRATIVNGHTLPLYAYIADNGSGWWNACISPSDRDQMMEHPLRMVIAGAPTLRDAKTNVERALRRYVKAIAAAYHPHTEAP